GSPSLRSAGRGGRHRLAGGHEHARPAAVAQLDAPAAGRALAIHQHHVGGVDVPLLLEDAAGAGAPAPRLQVALVDAHLLDPDAAALGIHRDHASLLAAVRTLDDAHDVALPDAECHGTS